MRRPKAAVGAARSGATRVEPRRDPAMAAAQAANVVRGDGQLSNILFHRPHDIAENVQESRTGAPRASRFNSFETTLSLYFSGRRARRLLRSGASRVGGTRMLRAAGRTPLPSLASPWLLPHVTGLASPDKLRVSATLNT